jgi:hypothetical protein
VAGGCIWWPAVQRHTGTIWFPRERTTSGARCDHRGLQPREDDVYQVIRKKKNVETKKAKNIPGIGVLLECGKMENGLFWGGTFSPSKIELTTVLTVLTVTLEEP